jgi:hypothetical protein
MGNMQQTMSHPLAKIFVPFFKTPSNIVGAVSERSPLALMMPSFYKAIKAGGAEADTALAKIALGTSVMATFATFAGGEAGDDVDHHRIWADCARFPAGLRPSRPSEILV